MAQGHWAYQPCPLCQNGENRTYDCQNWNASFSTLRSPFRAEHLPLKRGHRDLQDALIKMPEIENSGIWGPHFPKVSENGLCWVSMLAWCCCAGLMCLMCGMINCRCCAADWWILCVWQRSHLQTRGACLYAQKCWIGHCSVPVRAITLTNEWIV